MASQEELAAKAGAAYLDSWLRGRGWRGRINIERFDMNRSSDCVLGQLFGSYLRGLEKLNLPLQGPEACLVRDLGFAIYNPHLSRRAQAKARARLRSAWLREINGKILHNTANP